MTTFEFPPDSGRLFDSEPYGRHLRTSGAAELAAGGVACDHFRAINHPGTIAICLPAAGSCNGTDYSGTVLWANSGLEAGDTGWRVHGPGTGRTSDQAHTGSWSHGHAGWRVGHSLVAFDNHWTAGDFEDVQERTWEVPPEEVGVWVKRCGTWTPTSTWTDDVRIDFHCSGYLDDAEVGIVVP